jgi:hypothetical protein
MLIKYCFMIGRMLLCVRGREGQLLRPTITLHYKGNSVVDMVRKLMIVDLEVELE